MISTDSQSARPERAEPLQWRLLVIDDHPLVRRGLRVALSDSPSLRVVGEAADAAQALAEVRSVSPDLVTVDISLGRGNGLDLIKQLRAEFPSLKIVVVSMHDERIYAERALRAGADGYVSKGEPTEKLIDAIRTVLSGGTALTPAMTDRLVQQAVRRSSGRATGVEGLSDRELEVFEMIGAGLGTRVIAGKLGISIKTVETHRENIKRKLDITNAPELARFAVAWVENPV